MHPSQPTEPSHPSAQRPWHATDRLQPHSDLTGLWRPRRALTPKTPVATYGARISMPFGQALRARGYAWVEAEPPAGPAPVANRRFYYGCFSARTGSIASPALLEQWMRWAAGEQPAPDTYLRTGGRFFDALRPDVEPGGFATRQEARQSRRATLSALAHSISKARIVLLTLGTTERWRDPQTGVVYPVARNMRPPQTNAVDLVWDRPGIADTLETLAAAIVLMRQMNPRLSILLCVCPLALSETGNCEHVLSATMHAKSVLRVAAEELRASLPYVDYFPVYELLTDPALPSDVFFPEQRDLTDVGLSLLMDHLCTGAHTKPKTADNHGLADVRHQRARTVGAA